MKKKKRKGMIRTLQDRIKENKSTFAVYVTLRALVITVGVFSFFSGNYWNCFLCLLSLVLFLLPSLVEHTFKIDLPDTLEIIVLLFIFAAEILGEISSFYVRVPHWDTMLHTVNGFLCAAIGFALVDILNRSSRIKFQLSPLFLAIVAFCFSMTVGVLWEFFEYFMDTTFLMDMQKDTVINAISTVSLDTTATNTAVILENITDTVIITADGAQYTLSEYGLGGYLDVGIRDTMKDLIVNFIGAAAFSVIGYIYVKTRGKGRIAKGLIPTLIEEETHCEE